jgi:arylformamidase
VEFALILAVGGDESAEFHRQGADLEAAWSERGASVQVIKRSGLNHFTILADFADRESPLTRAVLGQMGLG